ncbi:MAG: hypothetical protein WBF33_20275 [Candidatus Nitrosopolaris sp.]
MVDNSTTREVNEEMQHYYTCDKGIEEHVIQAFTTTRQASINVEYPALHPISTMWNNKCSIHSLMPEEFITMFTSDSMIK